MRHIMQILLLASLLLAAGGVHAQQAKLRVVAATTLIADVARNVGGDLVEVVSIVPPDSDVHAFQPTPEDALKISQADVLLVNGAGLEEFLGSLVEAVGEVEAVVVSNGVAMLPFGGGAHDDDEHGDEVETVGILGEAGVCEDAEHDEHEEEEHEDEHEEDHAEDHEHGSCDPHVWTNPRNVMIWANNIAEAFAAADPVNAEVYRVNAAAYIAQLEALDADVAAILAVIPSERRVLVTNHEFFAYFAAHYGFEVAGVIISGGSTLSEPDPQTLADLIAVIQAEGVAAVFAEISAAPGLAEVIASETGITVVTTLYSDSLSAPDGPAATYLDYLRYNAQVIADALGG